MRLALVLTLAGIVCCGKKTKATIPDAAPIGTAPLASSATADPETVAIHATVAAPTIAAALKAAEPLLEADEAKAGVSRGSLVMAHWAVDRMKWSDVSTTKNETSFALAEKDIDAARGKRMCLSGRIDAIRALEAHDKVKFFASGLDTGERHSYSVLAVGSSATLVHGDRARFCGVVTALVSPEPEIQRTLYLVGMFDLPENRAR
jgi:hypothetical protein